MRKSKRIKIDDREITVYELRVKDIRQLMDLGEVNDVAGLRERIDIALPMATDLAANDMDGMAPSELMQVWGAFREVNADFFGWLDKTGIAATLGSTVLSELKHSMLQASSVASAGLSSEGTPPPPSTASASS